MSYLQINLFFFLSIGTIFCSLEVKNKFNFLNNDTKFKRNVKFQSNYYQVYNSRFTYYQNSKPSIKNFNDEQNYRKKRMVLSFIDRKWNLIIPYYVDVGVNHDIVDLALRIIQQETCIKFIKYSTMIPNTSGIRFYKGKGCFGSIGKRRGNVWQNISIGVNCDSVGIIQHETIHSLGFYHAHCRFDRNKYLSLKKKNIECGHYESFNKVDILDSKTFGIPIDFGSVMMYSIWEFSSNNNKTIIPYDRNYEKTMGNVETITFNDGKMINFYYCRNYCEKKIKCMNGGYQDPNDCDKCKCVEGFSRRWCHFLPYISRKCGNLVLLAKEKKMFLKLYGENECVYHIFSHNNEKIALFVAKSRFYPNKKKQCFKNNSLEIKYWEDKTSTGALFCLSDDNILIVTQNHHAMVYYRSNYELNYFKIMFKSVVKKYDYFNLKKEFLKEKLRLGF
uniref:Metalloendopeptidase n=1 Tax=Strongyloides stercoralis TaxID=6248 RepID=A0A0K0EPV8_STRER